MKPDLTKVVQATGLKGETSGETRALKAMLRSARRYLSSFRSCKSIDQSYYGAGVGGMVGIFLFQIMPAGPDVDEWIWVVVGDLPSAYLTARDALTPADALKDYMYAMNEWVEAVKNGKSVEDLIPVNVPPTLQYALMLEKRLRFLELHILPRCQ